MLYKFKSKATGDVIMLEANGRRVLQAIGKDPSPTGIVTAAQIPAAIAALEAAIAHEEAGAQGARQHLAATGAQTPSGAEEAAEGVGEPVTLRQRAKPFIDMLRRAERESADVVWGV